MEVLLADNLFQCIPLWESSKVDQAFDSHRTIKEWKNYLSSLLGTVIYVQYTYMYVYFHSMDQVFVKVI